MLTHTFRAISKRTLRTICISLQQSGDPCAQSAAECGSNLKDSLKFLGGILGRSSRGSSKPGSSYGISHRMARAFARVRQISSEVCCSGLIPVIRPPYLQSLEQVFLNLGTTARSFSSVTTLHRTVRSHRTVQMGFGMARFV